MDRAYARDLVHNFAVFGAIVAGLLALLVVAFFVWAGVQCAQYPSDSEMVRYFEKNRARFDALVHTDTWTQSELDALGIEDYPRGEPSGSVIAFDTYSSGLVGTSDIKGYLYSEEPVSPVVEDTDGQMGISYHDLGGGWYIFHKEY